MPETKTLGLCFSSRQLYYSISDSSAPNRVQHIGCFDFSFNVARSIRTQDAESFPAVYDLVGRLKKEFHINRLQLLTVSDHECWTTLPKLVYDDAEEREAHLSIIMKGIQRNNWEVNWHDLSNRDFKLASIRNSVIMEGFMRLAEHVHEANYVSSFELGDMWTRHRGEKGSFMMVQTIPGLLSISSYILGKLRGTTYIHFDDPEDLPYLWMYYANHVKWMSGLYDHVYIFGSESEQIERVLRNVIDSSAPINRFDSLVSMGVEAQEETYGFSLEAAFPAILLSIS
ncbi:hypothetical protein EP331_04000 [bacterium]|nr:MAG: hypothetical protein EP331_04000 [bacterium]